MKIAASFVRPMVSFRRCILAGSVALLLGAFAAQTHAESPNLLGNGGFEAGDFRDWVTSNAPVGQSYYGVTNRDSSIFYEVPPSNFGAPLPQPHPIFEGNFTAFFGGLGPQLDTISQTARIINQPLLKGKYKLSFRLALNGNAALGTANSAFRAQWNGNTIYSALNPAGIGSYQELEFSETASSSSSTVLFQAYNFSNYHYLDNVSLTLVGYEQSSFVPYAQTPNQHAVAKAIDSTVTDEDKLNPLVWFLDFRDLDALPGDFDRIAPEELSSIFTISTALAHVQNTNLQRRTDDIRSGSSGFSASGLAMQGSGPAYSGSLAGGNPQFRTGAAGPSGKESKEMKDVLPPDEKKWGAFLTGVGEWVDVDGDGNARGYDITTGGFTLGLDYKVNSNFAVGVAAGYAGTSADLTDDGRVWVNGGKLGVYATAFTGGWYGDAAVTGGYNSYDTKRTALQGTARGDTEGGELNVLVGTGYDWKIGALQIGPTATFQYTLVGMDGFTERGSLAPLAIDGRDQESLRSTLGFKMSADLNAGGVVIRPELRAAWQHEYGDQTYDISASFANGAGSGFLVNGPEIGRDSMVLGAGVAVIFSETFSTYVYYDGDLFRDSYESHSVSGGVRVAF